MFGKRGGGWGGGLGGGKNFAKIYNIFVFSSRACVYYKRKCSVCVKEVSIIYKKENNTN